MNIFLFALCQQTSQGSFLLTCLQNFFFLVFHSQSQYRMSAKQVVFTCNLDELPAAFSVKEEFSIGNQQCYGDISFIKTPKDPNLSCASPDTGFEIKITYRDIATTKIAKEKFSFFRYDIGNKIHQTDKVVAFRNWKEVKRRAKYGVCVQIQYLPHSEENKKQQQREEEAKKKAPVNFEEKISPAEVASVIASMDRHYVWKRNQEIAEVLNNGI